MDIQKDLSEMAELCRPAAEQLYGRLVAADGVATVAKLLHLQARRLWPEHTLIYPRSVLDRILQTWMHLDPPLATLMPLDGMLMANNFWLQHLPEDAGIPQVRMAFPDHYCFPLSLSLGLTPDSLRYFAYSRHPDALYRMFHSAVQEGDRLPVVPADRAEEFVRHFPAMWAESLIAPVTRSAPQPSIVYLPLEELIPIEDCGIDLLVTAILPAAKAREMALKLLGHSMPLEGKHGKALVVHGNDGDAMRWLTATQELLSNGFDGSLAHAVQHRILGARAASKAARENDIFRRHSFGQSHRRISREWLAHGVARREDGDPDNTLENVRKQVKDLCHKLMPSGCCLPHDPRGDNRRASAPRGAEEK